MLAYFDRIMNVVIDDGGSVILNGSLGINIIFDSWFSDFDIQVEFHYDFIPVFLFYSVNVRLKNIQKIYAAERVRRF